MKMVCGRFDASAGFTVLELLATIAIIGLAIAIAMPYWPGRSSKLALQTTSRAMLAALRLTRASAIARGADLAVAIDTDRRTFESPVVPMQSIPSDISILLTVAEPERTGRGGGAFRFFPDGSSTGGSVLFRLESSEQTVCVNWLTGEANEEGLCQ
jgi:general secretion pathway protein H